MSGSTLLLLSLLLLIAAPYIVYPLLLWLRAWAAPRPVKTADITPDVDLVICAHNEADVIRERLENALALDYPPEHLTIWVASDGSTDETVDIVRRFDPERVRCLDLPRDGKAAALNTCVASGNAEVVAFSDANSLWRPDALRMLIRSFADPRVGGVAGDQRYAGDVDGAHGERSYWSFDRVQKVWQSLSGSVISATGAIYAVRRELFEPTPPDATDDFMVSTAVIARGRRLVFERDAVALEPPASDSGEYRRKVRILTRGLRAVYYRRELLRPSRAGFYSVQLLLHKLWRRLAWIPMLLVVLAAPFYAGDGLLQALFAIGVVGAVSLGLAGLAAPSLRRLKPIDVATYILMVLSACAVATLNAARGRRVSHWSPTGTSAGAAP
jgi:cellulose synthase/poly-beta-1,6-N-acetylglucosamine synthase-like glycosyltransferase